MIKIGHGFDVHAFTDGEYLMIGGVKVPHDKAFVAHSDGDVLLHAIGDALLGALALGDIGKHFPDTDAAFKNIDSRILLRKIFKIVSERGYQIGNIDATIIAQAPKLRPYIDAMRACIALDLQTDIDNVNIKATTSEKLGFEGRKEGISAHAVCMIIHSIKSLSI